MVGELWSSLWTGKTLSTSDIYNTEYLWPTNATYMEEQCILYIGHNIIAAYVVLKLDYLPQQATEGI